MRRRKRNRGRRNSVLTIFLMVLIAVSGTFLAVTVKDGGSEKNTDDMGIIASGPQEVTRSIYVSREYDQEQTVEKIAAMFISSSISGAAEGEGHTVGDMEMAVVTSETSQTQGDAAQTPVVSDVEGAVLIYHTHSTESYEPYSEGNYHITGNEGTVRNVADELEAALKAKGITVYHDATLHDSPSYTNSYGRSLQTAKDNIAQHPDIKVVIDLHRDAMSSSGKKYSTIEVNGETVSSFNIVVGRQNANYAQLISFANKVLTKANEMYPGFGGRVIERDYKFNQYLSDCYLLLEVGNNGNRIEEVEASGRLLANVLEAVMREI